MAKDIETVLRNFIRHVTNLKAEDDPAGTGIHREFRMLREAQIQNKNQDRFPMEDGRKEENLKKNRYKDILPRDDRRVKLTPIPGEKGSDYINATFLEDAHKEYGYIAAQGPMPDTISDFWRMLWEYNTEIVFMACRTKEDGRAKCEKYWADLGQSVTFGDITTYTDSEEEVQDYFIRRKLRAVKNGETHQLTQFHYTGWPDHNIPSSPDALREMIEKVRNYRRKHKIPMVVHCSAGCGRTGTICAIDFAWTLLDEGLIEHEFSMFEIIKSMREQRMSMVQTPDQYEYTHMVMKSLCHEWLAAFAEHDYVNVTLKSASTPEPPEENYCNIAFGADDAPSSKEGVTSTSSKEALKPVKNAKGAAASNKPDVKYQKPEIKQKPDVKQPSPEVVKMKKQTSSTITTAPPRNFHVENKVSQEVDAGEYIEVRQTATISGKDSAYRNSPPSLPSKKNPPPNTAPLDPHKSDSMKTVITIPGGSASPQIVTSGSTGAHHTITKHRAPKPPIAQVTKGLAGLGGSTFGPQVSSGDEYTLVNKVASAPTRANLPAYENYQLPVPKKRKSPDQPAAKCTMDINSNPAKEIVPELPKRNYKPEEVHATTTATITSNNVSNTVSVASGKDARKPNYDNVIVTPSQHQQQQTRASPAPAHQMDPARAQAQTQAHTARPAQPPNRKGGGYPIGMVSAMGGGGGNQVAPVRHISPSGQQQTFFPASSDRRQGPVVMKAQSAGGSSSKRRSSVHESKGFFRQIFKGAMKGHSQPVPVPQPGQIIVANKGKRVYLTEHPQRVRGPRTLPQGWTTFSKNHRGTFL